MQAERDELKAAVAELEAANTELGPLREQAAEAASLKEEVKAAKAAVAEAEELYKKEQILRKKYWNMMEDMKGKIRVFARARPMSRSEIERGNTSVVKFPDDCTIELETSRGPRSFVYDATFGPSTTQEKVFEDTKRLVQSAFDGYNVCIFAYGQTGSGKTYTMTGAAGAPGVTPRAMAEIFNIVDANKKMMRATVSCYMVELYNGALVDLFHTMKGGKKSKAAPPTLKIKAPKGKMVVVDGAIVKEAPDAETILSLFDRGNAARHVGATKMNAESSRSHLIFSVLINVYNKATKKTTTGKLSLVDLAGSERVGKTGATADRLREAQAINQSLSALGDVISALSTGEKFIPYRNNPLTQLMSDSLGGNAKSALPAPRAAAHADTLARTCSYVCNVHLTRNGEPTLPLLRYDALPALMFVNISPADYNVDESVTSLSYASRVKLITNNADKNTDSEEVARLKRQIAALKAGKAAEDEDDEAAGGAGGDDEE